MIASRLISLKSIKSFQRLRHSAPIRKGILKAKSLTVQVLPSLGQPCIRCTAMYSTIVALLTCHEGCSMDQNAALDFCKSASTMQGQMQEAIVRAPASDENLQIALTLAGKQRFMDRPKTEPLEKTLARMQKNAALAPGVATLPTSVLQRQRLATQSPCSSSQLRCCSNL